MNEKTAEIVIKTAWTLVLIGMIATLASQVKAAPLKQATETPTPTAVTSEIVEFSDGNLELDHVITLGDIAVVIAVLFLAGIVYIYIVVRVVTNFLK